MEALEVRRNLNLEDEVFANFGYDGKQIAGYLKLLAQFDSSKLHLVGGILIERIFGYKKSIPNTDAVESLGLFKSELGREICLYDRLDLDFYSSNWQLKRDQKTTDVDVTTDVIGVMDPLLLMWLANRDIDMGNLIVIAGEKHSPPRATIYTRGDGPKLRLDLTCLDTPGGEMSIRSGFTTTLDSKSLPINKDLTVDMPNNLDLTLDFVGDIDKALMEYWSSKISLSVVRFFVQSLEEKCGHQIDINWGDEEVTNKKLELIFRSTVSILINRDMQYDIYLKLLNAIIPNWSNLRPELKEILKHSFMVANEIRKESATANHPEAVLNYSLV